jgi:predicted RNA-binding Zn-ribbon protein involved in translation (DUF1610 family)
MNAPTCPRCQAQMIAADRQPRTHDIVGLNAGSPAPPRITLKVWRCENCGIERPRFD